MTKRNFSLLAAVLLLAACSTASENAGTATADGAGNVGVSSEETNLQPTLTAEEIELAAAEKEGLDISVGDRVFFGYDNTDLSPEARMTLESQVAWLKKYPLLTVTIEGHADERGTREYNLALGERRAISVKNYLIALGVDPARIGIVSFGKERPTVLGTGEEVWQQNRRAVTVVN
ncbi:MAG TPA: peptidoglycan-associated lipoprotein Pal [Rhodospirillaceae bacterium]|nr:MAG: peptidoglycan-associated lipoprotein [Alphaproteobacteria bacterium GWF2_58_20]HAU29053.1 peptidoglycan-associated lipoprotein Pal [Rhodospirillaceae bacterium]